MVSCDTDLYNDKPWGSRVFSISSLSLDWPAQYSSVFSLLLTPAPAFLWAGVRGQADPRKTPGVPVTRAAPVPSLLPSQVRGQARGQNSGQLRLNKLSCCT